MTKSSSKGKDKKKKSDKPRRSLLGRFCGFCLKLTLVGAVLLLILGVAMWFSRGWLLEKTETLILTKLKEKEVFVSYDNIEYQVLRGLVMKEITLWEDAEHTVPQIKLGDVAFRPDVIQLVQAKKVYGHVSIDDAPLTLYTEGEVVAEVEGLALDADLDDEGLEVNALDGAIFGMEFEADGFFSTHKKEKTPEEIEKEEAEKAQNGETEKKEKKKLDFRFFAAVAKWASFESKGEKPNLDVDFHIDRNAEDPIIVEGALEGSQIEWRGLPLDSADIEFAFSGGKKTVQISKLELGHRGGKLSGSVLYGLEGRTITVEGMRSTLDPIAFANDLPFELGDKLSLVDFETDHPELRLDALLMLKDFPSSNIKLEIPQGIQLALHLAEEKRVTLKGVNGIVAFNEGTLVTNELGLTVYGLDLEATGTVALGKGKAKAKAVATADQAGAGENTEPPVGASAVEVASTGNTAAASPAKPKKDIRQVLGGIFAIVERWTSFSSDGANPKLATGYVVDMAADDPVTVSGKLSGKNFAWQGAALDSVNIDFSWSQGAKTIDLPQLEIIYRGDPIRGGVNYVVPSKQLRLNKVTCEADWVALASDLPFGLEKQMANYELPDPPELTMDGLVNIGNIFASAFTVEVPRSVPVTVALGERKIAMQGFRGKVRLAERTIHSENIEILLGTGKLDWNGAFTPSEKAYDGTLVMTDLPLAELLKLAGKEPMAGVVNGEVTAAGDGEVVMRNGTGKMKITEAEALKIPVVGGLLSVLSKVAPVFGTTTDGIVSLTFVTENGVMKTDNLTAKGSGFVVEGGGWVNWNDQSTEFQATANFDGVMKLITLVASKALEVEGSGPLNDIEWRLKNLDPTKLTDSVRGLFGVGGEFLGAGGDGVTRLGEGVMKVGEGAVEGVGKVGEGVLKVGEGAVEGVGKVGEGVKKVGEGAVEGVTEGVDKVRQGLRGLIPGMGKKDKEKPPQPKPVPEPAKQP